MVHRLILVLLLAISSALASHSLLLPITSKHAKSTDKTGESFNENNYGIGYQYSTPIGYSGVYNTYTILFLNDSYNHNMLTATYGIHQELIKKYVFSVAIGTEFGVSSKKTKFSNPAESEEFHRKLLPIAFIPTLRITYKEVSAILTHIPQVSLKDVKVYAVTLMTVSYEF